MNAISGALELRALAMNIADVRQTIAAVGEQQSIAPGSGHQPADVILELSLAAKQLLRH
jgi:hypothetical protein